MSAITAIQSYLRHQRESAVSTTLARFHQRINNEIVHRSIVLERRNLAASGAVSCQQFLPDRRSSAWPFSLTHQARAFVVFFSISRFNPAALPAQTRNQSVPISVISGTSLS
jgi:hypothetical protein